MAPEFEPDLLSVVLPTFNRAPRIARALDSVLAQSYRPVEIIVVDDGSTDETGAVVGAWADKHGRGGDLRLHYLRQGNSGAPAARNAGLVASHGEFIQYLDSDDVLDAGKVQSQIQAMKAGNFEFVWSSMKLVREGAVPRDIQQLRAADGVMYFTRAADFPDAVYVGIYRRRLCVKIGPWDEGLSCRQDWDYRYRCELLDPPRQFIPGTYYIAVEHGAGRINDKYETAEGAEAGLRALDRAREISKTGAVRLDLYGRYLLSLRISLACRRDDFIGRALDGMAAQAPSRGQALLVRCLRALWRAAGSRVTLRALDVYSTLRASNLAL